MDFFSSLLAASLVSHGIGVVSANYRLSPGVMHPAHMEDATAAVAWTIRNIASYGATRVASTSVGIRPVPIWPP